MVSNLTSHARRNRAFTLVETLLASSIGLLVLTAALVLWAYASRTCASLLNYADLSSQSKYALDSLSQQIRNAKSIQSCSAQQLVLLDPDDQVVTVAYDSSAKKLAVRQGTTTRTLLTGCTNFQFAIYQRTPISNSFQFYTNGFSTNTAKVVQMQWSCMRKLTGSTGNAENQVSAMVVVRNL